MKRVLLWLAVSLVAALLNRAYAAEFLCTATSSDSRLLAIVIGNADYDGDGHVDVTRTRSAEKENHRYVGDLDVTFRDAERIGRALCEQGYSVTLIRDADQAALVGAISQFNKWAVDSDAGDKLIFYFSGHSVQVEEMLYLIPVSAKIVKDPRPLEGGPTYLYRDVAVEPLVALGSFHLPPKPPNSEGFNLIVLDSCRNNPWPDLAGRGIPRASASPFGPRRNAYMEAAGSGFPSRSQGTILALAAAPGSAALAVANASSPFTDALLKHMGEARSFRDVFDRSAREVIAATLGKQSPHIYDDPLDQKCLTNCVMLDSSSRGVWNISDDLAPGTSRAIQKAFKAARDARRIAQNAFVMSSKIPDDRTLALDTNLSSRNRPLPGRPNGLYRVEFTDMEFYSGRFIGEVKRGQLSGKGLFYYDCTIVFLRSRCPLKTYQVFAGEFRFGKTRGLGMLQDLVTGYFGTGVFRSQDDEWGYPAPPKLIFGLLETPHGVTEIGRFENGNLVHGLRWTNYGALRTVVQAKVSRRDGRK